MNRPTFASVEEAARRIEGRAHRTPVLRSAYFDDVLGARVFFKAENLQKAGAFKFRGACNAVWSLTDEEAARGVLTHSSGNHAQALALAARRRGVPAHIVMPRTALPGKRAAVEGYGGSVTLCEPTLASREETAAAILKETGAVFIHPYDDWRIICGQATAALELLQDVPDLDVVVAPVGGGGLLSGTLLSCARLAPGAKVYGAEPSGADDAARSLREGRIVPSVNPDTLADGLLTSLSEKTFAVIREHAAGIATVEDEHTVRAMRLVLERMKTLVEPSAAVPLAALLSGRIPVQGLRAGVIFSGGNANLDDLPW